MADLNIAVMLTNLRLEPYEGLEKAAEMGVPGVHLSVDAGIFSPEELDAQGRKELLKHLASLNLEVSALSAWGGHVHLEEDDVDEHIEQGKRVLELAVDLECGIWQAHVGIIPEDESDPGWQNQLRHHEQIAKHGEKVGACLAIETGPEPPYVLKRLIETIGSEAIRINWDPGNLILWPARFAKDAGEQYDRDKWWNKFQPIEGVKLVGEYIVHTHAKDALVREDGTRQEVPLGTGWIDWQQYTGLLAEQGYDGYFAIEREVGDDPVGDIETAVEFLRSV